MASQKDFKIKNGLDVAENVNIAGTLTVGNTTVSSVIDSSQAISLVDSSYVQLRQDYSYSSLTGAPNVLDSANVNSLIDSGISLLIDGAPGALNTLNELAAALNDDSNFATTITNQIAALPDSAQVITLAGNLVDSAYVQARELGDASRGFSIAMSIAL